MKNTVQELGATADATTTGSTGFDSISTGVVGKVWLKELLAAAQKHMYFAQFAYQSTAPKGNRDVALPLFTSNLDFNDTTAQATTRHMTEIDNLTTVTFTPSTHKFGVAIAKDVVRTSQVDTVKFAREQMVYDASLTIDTAFDTALKADVTNTQLWGGLRAAEGSLVAGDTLDPAIIARANRILKAHGWRAEPAKPFVLIIPPVCEEALMNDSQFMNASEYGTNEVIMNGEIGKYIGIKVVVSEQCSGGTFNSLAGHYAYLFKSQVSYGIVYGEKPTLSFDYDKERAEYRVYLDMCYEIKVLQGTALQVMKVLDE